MRSIGDENPHFPIHLFAPPNGSSTGSSSDLVLELCGQICPFGPGFSFESTAMKQFVSRRMVRFLKHDEGVTAVECALMLALVVVICVVALAPSATPNRSTPSAVVLENDRE
jgi:Flp pilus assembly pilin Flp